MKLLRSIKTRLLFWQMLLLAGVLTPLLSLHYHIRHNELIASTDIELRRIQMLIMPVIAPVDTISLRRPSPLHGQENPDNPEFIAGNTLANIEKENAYVISWSLSGNELVKQGKVPESLQFETYKLADKTQQTCTRDGNRELIIRHGNRKLIVIGRPLKHLQEQMGLIRQNLTLIGVLVLLVGWISGRVIVRRGLLPVKQISETAREIAEGRREKRIELSDAPEELEGMAITLNNTFDSLDEAIKRQARFTADASHELRTPISVIMAQAQATLRNERTPEQYIATLTACLRAAKRMKSLSDSLLDLTRIDAHDLKLDMRKCELGPVLSEAVELADDISENHKVRYVDQATPVTLTIDKDRIHQSVINLIGNSIKYNPEGCSINVVLDRDGSDAVIRIRDDGVGIPAEHLPYVFERFYRIDRSRSREKGGSGLGLSIVQSIVEAHRGTISATSEPGVCTEFTIRLPGQTE